MNTSEKMPEKARFMSLKWKTLMMLTALFIMVNIVLMWAGYNHLQNFFNRQLTDNIENSASVLLENASDDLLLLAASAGLAAGNEDQTGVNQQQLINHMADNWPMYELDHGLEGAALFAPRREKTFNWGNADSSRQLQRLVTRVYLDLEPETQIICLDVCHLYAAQPLLMEDSEAYVLVLRKTLDDFIIQLSQNHNLDIALLRKHIDTDSQPGQSVFWGYQLAGITSKQRGMSWLSELEQQHSLNTLLEEGLNHRFEDLTIYFHVIPVETHDHSTRSFLILMTDISEEYSAIYSNLLVTAGILIAGVLIIILALYLALKRPMQRITKQAELLPLLAQSGFATVRYEINRDKNSAGKHICDELDILEDTAISLSYQLERMEKEIQNRTRELEDLAHFDALTGLANRRNFIEKLEHVLDEARTTHNTFAIAFIDLDNFKRINDSLGHDAGDSLLQEVSTRLIENVRSTDIVARLGGDEFTLILPEIHHIDNVRMIMDKILLSFQQPVVLVNGKDVQVTPSIGIAVCPEHSDNVSDLMRCADLAMYSAKHDGKNRYHFFNEKMNEEIQESLQLEKDIISAINNGQFRLFYQPIIDLRSGRVIRLEALIRWQHPERGLLAPFHFIDMLEHSGQIVHLGPQLFEMACLAIKVLDHAGLEHISIAMNISAKQFNDPDLIDKLLTVVEQMRVHPSRLELEITENTLMENLEHQCFILSKLQSLGFTISIDDFGTGYSSLSYLKELPANILKIDRSFVKDIPLDKQDVAITSAIIAMAHKLSLDVVAEGIETDEQEAYLKELGCEYGQGYLFQKPEPLETFIEQLQKNHAGEAIPYYQ